MNSNGRRKRINVEQKSKHIIHGPFNNTYNLQCYPTHPEQHGLNVMISGRFIIKSMIMVKMKVF